MNDYLHQNAIIATDGWAGRIEWPCKVIGETKTKFRIEATVDDIILPRRVLKLGNQTLVPKRSVRILK